MKLVILGGYGEIGTIIAKDLAATGKDFEVVVTGRDLAKAEKLVDSIGVKHLTAEKADVNKKSEVMKVLKGADVTINATNYYTNVEVMKMSLESGAHYLDLGGLFHTTMKQMKLHKAFKDKGLLALLGMGSTPGITNLLALHGARQLDSVSEIHVAFGDKDYTKYTTPFMTPYSMQTVFDEFTMPAPVFKDGRLTYDKALGGEVVIDFPAPVGKLKCWHAIHSEVATLPYSFKGVKACSFRGAWDPGFIDKTKFLIDAGFSSYDPVAVDGVTVKPRSVSVSLLNRFIPDKRIKMDDIEYLRIAVTGKKNGKTKTIAEYMKAFANKRYNIPAGVWDTAVPPSILAQMMAKGEIKTTGAVPPERIDIDFEELFDELKRRNITVFSRLEKSGE
jgi:saccharopine dehydrogenase-like NADP-dependent oxidoreductase